MKITLAMICKNEGDNLRRCLPSIAQHVDEIVIADTGSTDDTRQVATQFGASVYQFDERNHPECFFFDDEATCKAFGYDVPGTYSNEIAFANFAAARNESFKHATGDYIVWVDADDVVEGAEHLRDLVADLARKPQPAFGFLKYDYARDDKERSFYTQWRERIIRKGAATWLNPVHEVLMPSAPIMPVRYDQILIVHRRKADRKQTPNRNYKILLRQLKDDYDNKRNVDPRTLFYLGQEARFIEPTKAVGFYEQYLKLSGWPEERAAAHCAIGETLEFGQVPGIPADEAYARANREYAAAAVEVPENPDGVFGLARIAYLRGRMPDCIRYTETGLKIGNTDSMLGMNPMNRLYRPHVYYNHALAQMGRVEDAAKSCEAAIAVCPDDPGIPGGASGMLTLNLKVYRDSLKAPVPAPARGERQVASLGKDEPLDTPPAPNVPHDAYVIWSIQLWKTCIDRAPDGTRAHAFLDSLPPSVAADPVVHRMREETIRRFGAPPPSPREVVDQMGAILRGAIHDITALTDDQPHIVTRAVKNIRENLAADAARDRARDAMEYADRIRNASQKIATATEMIGKLPLSIVFWIGHSFEPWDPTTPSTKGIGGSETACIEMARNLVSLGHRVTVYGDCEKTAGIYDGVRYEDFRTCPGVDCDVFIASRQPWIMDDQEKIKARLKLLWVHDIHVGPQSPQLERWLLRFDRILCLSKWHKDFFCSQYPTLHPDRVIVTRNGIDPARFANPLPKTNRLIFSSSPNRGLASLLAIFPRVRAQVPDAELHIYYGVNCWKKMALTRNDPAELAAIERYEHMADGMPGVTWHGLVNQRELAEAFLRSKVWLYPTLGPELFAETYCVSAAEAMAAGAVPVTTAFAALNETVKHGILIKPDDPNAPNEFVLATVAMLRDEDARASHAVPGREWAMNNLSWHALAADWASMFARLIPEVAKNPIAAWRAA